MSANWLRWAVVFHVLAFVSAMVAVMGPPVPIYWIARSCLFAFPVAFIVTAAVSALRGS